VPATVRLDLTSERAPLPERAFREVSTGTPAPRPCSIVESVATTDRCRSVTARSFLGF
jgi:hypothetical protein